MSTTVHIVGHGIVARRLHRMLHAERVMVHDARWSDVSGTVSGDVVVIAHGGEHAPAVPGLLRRGLHVVTVGDEPDDADRILGFGDEAVRADRTLVCGAALSPGLSGLIARHLAGQMQTLDELHVAVHGTAGPSCARSYHRALSGRSTAWHDRQWVDYVGGSGRELCWFPEPIGAKDCYRARLATPRLLQRSFPDVERISIRRSARRRDRLTAWLPMLSPPHHEGGVGALRVEARGSDASGARRCLVAGVAELVGTAAAATVGAFVRAMVDGDVPTGLVLAGDAALPTTRLLRDAERLGIRLQEFTGVPQPS